MLYDARDTIVAIGTAPASGAARGVVRIGGPDTVAQLDACFVTSDEAPLTRCSGSRCLAGAFQLRGVNVSRGIPCDLFLWPDERSYTRQPLAELHLPGAPPLLQAVVEELTSRGARIAQPGEFTLRAFLAGRIDLTQAEAVLGLVDAADGAMLDAALAQMAGGLSAPLMRLREHLLSLLAELEAGLDFADEDLEFVSRGQLLAQIAAAEGIVAEALAQLDSRTAAAPAAVVVLAGPPNAGKSSLFNALVARYSAEVNAPQALVSEVSGTTRDYVSATLRINAQEFTLIDTAGWNLQDADAIARAAQQATADQSRSATLLLHCQAADEVRGNAGVLDEASAAPCIHLLTKSDLASTAASNSAALACSSATGAGFETLAIALSDQIGDVPTSIALEGLAHTAARCVGSLRNAAEALASARQLGSSGGEELISAEIRTALDRLGEVVGAVYTDDVLDRIFSQFCIGK